MEILTSSTDDLYRRLLAATADEDSRPVLEALLGRWCELHAVSSAALYSRGDTGLERLARLGPETFPNLLDELGAAAQTSRRRDFGGCSLLWVGEVEIDECGPLELLLATAVKAQRLQRELKRRRFRDNYRGVGIEVLYDVGMAIASTLDIEVLTEEILLRAVGLLDARRGALWHRDGENFVGTSAVGGAATPTFKAAADRSLEEHMRRWNSEAGVELLPGASHVLVVPVEIQGEVEGLLAVADKESRMGVGPFSTEDERTLALFANQAAIALETARLHVEALEKERLDRDMEVAAEIQRQILPRRQPKLAGFEVYGSNRPARQVGGDYYDFIPTPDGRWIVALGDISGKGVPAALMVSAVHSAMRLLLEELRLSPEIMGRLNQHLHASSASNKFLTLFATEIDPALGTLTYVNAGHDPGLWLRRSGVEKLKAHGLPVGMLPRVSYGMTCLELEPGDLICLYSDGLTECHAPDDEEFGIDRLEDLVVLHRDAPLPEIGAALDQALRRFAAGTPQGDDQTLVLIRRVNSSV